MDDLIIAYQTDDRCIVGLCRITAVRLRHLGALRNNAELKKLVAFHDRKRKYPTEALLPMVDDLRALGTHIADTLTLDQARRLLASLSSKRLEAMLARRGAEYVKDFIAEDFEHWGTAWGNANLLQRRMIAALAALSDSLHDDGDEVWASWLSKHVRLPLIQFPLKAPQFAWHRKYGLCLVSESASRPDSIVEVFRWGRNDRPRFQAKVLRAVVARSSADVLLLEREALWTLPPWLSG